MSYRQRTKRQKLQQRLADAEGDRVQALRSESRAYQRMAKLEKYAREMQTRLHLAIKQNEFNRIETTPIPQRQRVGFMLELPVEHLYLGGMECFYAAVSEFSKEVSSFLIKHGTRAKQQRTAEEENERISGELFALSLARYNNDIPAMPDRGTEIRRMYAEADRYRFDSERRS